MDYVRRNVAALEIAHPTLSDRMYRVFACRASRVYGFDPPPRNVVYLEKILVYPPSCSIPESNDTNLSRISFSMGHET